VDRGALGGIVFSDKRQLEALNRILHPLIRREIRGRIGLARRKKAVRAVVLDAAVMIEAGWDDMCTNLVFVRAPRRERMRRVLSRRRWDAPGFLRREKSQISLDTKKRKCYFVIDNSSSLARLREQVREIFSRLVPVE